ncbi:MAG: ferritin-like domain-containing protein [Isosphaeraceae bacterium]|nr:ferritin-like domain-containing protein [Isosphaeraceae bacterium]
MTIGTLFDQFLQELGNVYDAEHHFLEAMRSMVGQARNETLRMMLEDHIRMTEEQLRNLEQVYRHLGRPPERIAGQTPPALVADGRRLAEAAGERPEVRDGILASALAKVESFEVTCYRGLVVSAELVGRAEVTSLLRENLDGEEKTARLAESYAATLKQRASAAGAGGEIGVAALHSDCSGQVAGPLVGHASAQDPAEIGMGAGEAGPAGFPVGSAVSGAAAPSGTPRGPGRTGTMNAVEAGLGQADEPSRSVASPDEIAAGIDAQDLGHRDLELP